MTATVTINRLQTGVPGLDDILGGGLPEFSFNLIAGLPGAGKTTLAHQIMFSLASAERPALYLTVLGEPPLKMLRYQQQFSFFDGASVNRSIRFVNLAEETLSGDLNQVLTRIIEEVEAHPPALLFVDSFRSVVMSNLPDEDAENRVQQFMQQLGMLMTSWQATTFLIGEYFTETDANPVFTVADGLIWLRQSVQRNSMVRKIEIMKMRGQGAMPGQHSFRISGDGIEIFAPAAVAVRAASPDLGPDGACTQASALQPLSRLRMGNAQLDAMLGGGLPVGYSLLIAGPSGSGKSLIAAEFLAQGARDGETGVIAVFEQHPTVIRSPTLAALIANGHVGLVDNRSADLSIDEVVTLILREIRRLKATRVVIDSLSGFELRLAPTFREDFRESMLRLVITLTAAGVTLVMTCELEDRYTDFRVSPHCTAFLTDAIIVQRYIELGSRLRRLMAVVKVRSSMHSDQLREYTIDQDGVHIGGMLPEQEGLLAGRPTRRRATGPRLPKGVKRRQAD